jgi:hypothetical protein
MLEKTILSNLILNDDYSRKVFPYIKEDYFEENSIKKIFSTYAQYVEKYKESPSLEALKISLDKRKDLNEQSYKDVMVWNHLGIDAVCPPTEALFINEDHLNYFKLIYKNIIVNFDNDETGVKKSIEFTQQDNLGYFNIP